MKKGDKFYGWIYLITNKVNNRKYVGQTTTSVSHRFNQHIFRGSSDNPMNYRYSLIDKAIHKYGKECFEVRELEEIASGNKNDLKILCDSKEQYWIKYYNTYLGKGYNQTPGGDTVHITTEIPVIVYNLLGEELFRYSGITECSRNLNIQPCSISIAINDPNYYHKCSNYIIRPLDNPLSFDDIEQIKLKYPRLYQYDFSGNLVNVFDSVEDAIKYMISINKDCTAQNLNQASSGISKSCKGFIWRKYPDTFDKYELPPKVKNRMVEKRNQHSGELVETYNNIYEASDKNNIPYRTILTCCRKENNQIFTNGYHWCYVGDYQQDLIDQYYENYFNIHGILQYDLYSNLINSYKDINQLINSTDYTIDSIRDACITKKPSYGFFWCYKKNEQDLVQYINNLDKSNYKNLERIYQYDINGKFIREYANSYELNKDGFRADGIRRSCDRKSKSISQGYIWEYKKDATLYKE